MTHFALWVRSPAMIAISIYPLAMVLAFGIRGYADVRSILIAISSNECDEHHLSSCDGVGVWYPGMLTCVRY